MVRSMMCQTTLQKFFWDYALETAARILNMVPTKKRDTLTKPDKLEPRSIKCIFRGYPKKTMGYSFYYLPDNKVLVAQNAKFIENSLITQEASRSLEDLKIIQEEDTHHFIDTSLNHEEDDLEIEEPQSHIIPIRRSTRLHRLTDRMCLYIDAEEHELGDLGEPANYKAALLDPESHKWLNAMNVKMQFMKDNKVWDLVELPPNEKIVGSKWLFKKKIDMDGAIHTYKVHLVTKGYTQTLGIDYEETFSPIADIRAIRILIAIATHYNYEIWQMDVKTVFLNGYLSEEVYMEQPEGFVNPKYPNRVCKLKRSIYGLKQASRQWNKRFDDEIKKFSFTQNRDEPCVYLKAIWSNITFLILYVDDILIMGNNIPMLQDVKSYIRRCFAMKDLGEAAYILGIKIYKDRSQRLIGLCQSAYIEKILKRYHMKNSKRGSIPMQEKLRMCKSQGASTPAELKRIQNVPYASAVGSIMYVVRCTRPDAAGAVDWKSAKQNIFATSSTKAECIVAFDAFKEADHGIIAHHTAPYTPQHNRVSGRRNRTLLDMVRSMMSQITLPKFFWDYALEIAARILNMVSTKKPDKLELRSIKCIFIGYPKETMGYSFYYPPENKVLVARNAKFLKNSLITQEASESLEDLEIIQEEDMHISIDTSLNHEEDDLEIDEPQRDLGELANYKAALLDHESDKWLNAINVEIQSMKDNKDWDLVELPPNGKNLYGGDIKRELGVFCYIDAGYLTDADDLKSQTGYAFVLNGGAEAVWVRKFTGLGVVPTIEEPISMYCDNTRVISIANESGITKGARHFRFKVHYLREVIEYGDVKLEKVHTNDNLADPFTKALTFLKLSEHTKNIEMLPASSLM
nr:retrotransposon protein, putative, Ty1-copia subclass [Tanacetum cinerariifolium]